MKSKILNPICLALLSLIAFSCTKEIPIVPITDVALSKTSLLIKVGSSDTLKVVISPLDATSTNLKWTSENPAIATVSKEGVVTGVAPGNATITATTADGKITTTCAVNTIKWTIYQPNHSYSDYQRNFVVADAEGNIWCGSADLNKFDGTNWTTYLQGYGISAMAIDARGNKWFGTYGSGVFKFDGTNWTNYTAENSGLKDNTINKNAITADPQGNVWFGTSSRVTLRGTGVSKFDGSKWTTYNSDNGLVYNLVLSISSDAQGNKWFATGKGISKFDGITWTSYTSLNSKNELVDRAYFITIDAQGNKWIGTSPGVLKFDGTNWTNYTTSNSGLAYDGITSIAIDAKGNKWFGTLMGVSKFDGTNWTNFGPGSGLHYAVMSIAIDPQGNKWLWTGIGLYKLEDGSIN